MIPNSPVPEISVVVPVYKEEANIRPFVDRMVAVLTGLSLSYEIVFCLDPSPDRTEEVIVEQARANPAIKLITFSRRFGQPAATLAGLFHCQGNTAVVIDVDLQDPPELIGEMYRKLSQGFGVVYAKRRSRKGETFVKRVVAAVGYWVIARLSDVEIPRNTGDFRIMTRRVIEELRKLNETHGFLRGLVAVVGFKQTFVEYDRDERLSGEGNYNRFTGSLKIGLNGLISFSSKPLGVLSIAGALFIAGSAGLASLALLFKLTGYTHFSPFTLLLLAMVFFTGIQLLSLGLMGEYVGRIYDEVKRRPLYIVDRKVDFSQGDPESVRTVA
jgi:glycosyltransferase involved in cell wall biosynthesis